MSNLSLPVEDTDWTLRIKRTATVNSTVSLREYKGKKEIVYADL